MFPLVDTKVSEQPTINSTTNDLKRDFSFSRTELSGDSTLRLKDILADLHKIPHDKLCQLFMDEIFQCERLRNRLLEAENKNESNREEIAQLKESIRKRTEQFMSMNDRQRINTQKIASMQEEMKKFKHRHNITTHEIKPSEWQQKYNELWRNVDMYIANIKELQESFRRHKEMHSSQMAKMYSNNESMMIRVRQQEIRIAILEEMTRNDVPRTAESEWKEQLQAADKLLGQFKSELALVNTELELTKAQLKKEQDRNGEIRQELDRFCMKKRDFKGSDEVLSLIDMNQMRSRKWSSQNKQNSVWDKQNNSCIIGQEFTTS